MSVTSPQAQMAGAGGGSGGGMGWDAIEWVCHSPSPYNDHLFRTLAGEFGDGFRVHYMHGASPIRPWRTELGRGYRWRVYESRVLDATLLRNVINNPRAVLVTGAWQDPTSQVGMARLALARRPYLIWNDVPDLAKKRPIWKGLPRDLFLRWTFRNARAVMGTGQPALDAFREMGCPPDKLVNFPYFIDLNLFPFRPAGNGTVVEFGSVARMVPEKGLDIAIEALGRLRRAAARPFRYRIIGDGPQRQALTALAERLHLDVEFLGWKETAELPAFYQGIHFLLQTPRFDPWNVPVTEAMASGCVAIATRSTAAAVERISDGVSGLLAPTSVDGVSRALSRAMQLPDQDRLTMARSARAVADQWRAIRGVEILGGLL